MRYALYKSTFTLLYMTIIYNARQIVQRLKTEGSDSQKGSYYGKEWQGKNSKVTENGKMKGKSNTIKEAVDQNSRKATELDKRNCTIPIHRSFQCGIMSNVSMFLLIRLY